MSHLSAAELASLHFIADELIEATASRGYRVESALAVDPAFGSGRSRSSLLRDLVVDVIGTAATHRVDADFRSVNGAGREVRFCIDVDRRFRVLRGRRNGRGDLVVSVNSDSTLSVDEEQIGLWPFEQWALVWVADDDCLINEIIAAEVRDVTVGSPGQLVFGDEIHLGSGPSVGPGTFIADTTGLDEFLDEFLDGDLGDEPGEQSA